MHRYVPGIAGLTFALLLPLAAGCQKPSKVDSITADDITNVTITPDPAVANQSTDGRSYRVVRGNNQPDDILAYDWKTSFDLGVLLNEKADDDGALTFPVKLTSATLKVQQASGGIVSTPTGTDAEHYDYVTTASGNTYGAVNSSVSMHFDVWYDLPSLKKEALVTVALVFTDDDGKTVAKSVEVPVAP